ncbi:glycoside hydrolase family 28 protein [Muricauda sp. ANG21]|uniref:rhamnogalacturonidase n=1 Tax=Allomuricauda sp. ANG21 TaxID=3042468 RepID=UPI0034530718
MIKRNLLVVFFVFNAIALLANEVNVYNVKKYGAVGDGKKLDTDAINKAINDANKEGGGMVYFPPGTYLSASIHLKSNITLYLEVGSVIEAVHDSIAKYDFPEVNEEGGNYQDFGHSHWKNSLIWGIGLENISILGPGLIYGKGLNPGYDLDTGIYKDGGEGTGNKAISLKECRNVLLRDFSILHGGHFGILATGVDNLTIDNLKIDTNRDGIDVDACRNVRISNCSVNSPWDDGICLKSSYGLGKIKNCENITIANCFLTGGFDEGTLLDGTFKVSAPEYKSHNFGRIKLGTESNGDFKNITITNCVFDRSRGIAIESVDGAHIEDIAISNITMRHLSKSPIFIRLGSRLRGPKGTRVGTIKRITINNVIGSDANGRYTSSISAIPGHYIEDVQISNVRFNQQGGGEKELASIFPPENEADYPEPGMYGLLPAYGFYIRHVKGLDMSHVKLDYNEPEARPAFVLEDVHNAYFYHLDVEAGVDGAPFFDLRNVSDFSVEDFKKLKDTQLEDNVFRLKL